MNLACTSLVTLSFSFATMSRAAIIIDGNPYAATAALVTHSSAFTGFGGELAYDGTSSGTNRWATLFPEGAVRNEWLLVDLGADVTIQSISIDWEAARSSVYTWRIRSSMLGLPAGITEGTPGSLTFGDFTQIASSTSPLTTLSGNVPASIGTADQFFNFAAGTTSDTQYTAAPNAPTMTVNDSSPTGRYLLLAITTQWERTASTDGSSPYEINVVATSVPEPSMAFTGGMGLLALLAGRRRRS